jgi:hypothetical protein
MAICQGAHGTKVHNVEHRTDHACNVTETTSKTFYYDVHMLVYVSDAGSARASFQCMPLHTLSSFGPN